MCFGSKKKGKPVKPISNKVNANSGNKAYSNKPGTNIRVGSQTNKVNNNNGSVVPTKNVSAATITPINNEPKILSEEEKQRIRQEAENQKVALEKIQLGNRYFEKLRREEALKAYEEALKVMPTYYESYVWKSYTLFSLGRDEEAKSAYEKAVEFAKFKDNTEIRLLEALSLKSEREFNDALVIVEKVIKESSGHHYAHHIKGKLLFKLGRNEDALKALEAAIYNNSRYPIVYLTKGNILKALNKTEDALASYQKALDINAECILAQYEKEVILFEKLENKEDALPFFKKACELMPGNADPFYYIGLIYESYLPPQDDLALESYKKGLSINPKHANCYLGRGRTLLKEGAKTYALMDFQKACALDPKNLTAFNHKGFICYQLEKYEDAIKAFNRVIKLNPKHYDACFNRGLALFGLHQYEDALKDIKKACDLCPGQALYFEGQGKTLSALKKYKEALECFDKAINLHPYLVQTHYLKGVTLRDLGRYEEALKCFDRVLNLNPNHSVTTDRNTLFEHINRDENTKTKDNEESENLYIEGLSSYTSGEYPKAKDLFSKSILYNPQHEDAWNNLGLTKAALGDKQDALGCFRHVLFLNEKHESALINTGDILMDLKRNAEALENYEVAVALNTKSAKAFFNYGILLNAINRNVSAMNAFRNAVKLDPNYKQAYFNLAINHMDIDEYKDALEPLNELIRINPNNADAFNKRGLVLKELTPTVDGALEAFNQALTVNPNHLEALNNKGVCLMSLKRDEEALQCFEKAISIKPDYADSYANKALFMESQDKHKEALETYDKAILLDDTNSIYYINRGKVHHHLKDYLEAFSDYNNADAYMEQSKLSFFRKKKMKEVLKQLISDEEKTLRNAQLNSSLTSKTLREAFVNIRTKVAETLEKAVNEYDIDDYEESLKYDKEKDIDRIKRSLKILNKPSDYQSYKNNKTVQVKHQDVWKSTELANRLAETVDFINKNAYNETKLVEHCAKLMKQVMENSHTNTDKNLLNHLKMSLYFTMLFDLGDGQVQTDIGQFQLNTGAMDNFEFGKLMLGGLKKDNIVKSPIVKVVNEVLGQEFGQVNTNTGFKGFESIKDFTKQDVIRKFFLENDQLQAKDYPEAVDKLRKIFMNCKDKFSKFQAATNPANLKTPLPFKVEYSSGTKSFFRIQQKFRELAYNDKMDFQPFAYRQMWDMIRCTYYLEKADINEVRKLLEVLEKDMGMKIVRLKNKMASHLQNFTLNVIWKDIICEVQIVCAKDESHHDFGHMIYELQRCTNFVEMYIVVIHLPPTIDYVNYLRANLEAVKNPDPHIRVANELLIRLHFEINQMEKLVQ